MNTHRQIGTLIGIFLLFAFLVSSCRLPGPQPTPTLSPTETFTAFPTAPQEAEPYPLPTLLPICHPEALEPALLNNPGEGEVLELDPITFSWTDHNSCEFESYQLNLVYPLVEHGLDEVNFYQTIPHPVTSHQLPENHPLPPGVQISWSVRPIISQQPGPDGTTQTVWGPRSRVSHFFTGPLCSPDQLTSPILSKPEDGEEIYPGLTSAGWIPEFVWLDPSACLPDQYRLQFSLTERWLEPDLEIDTNVPINRWKADRMLEQGVVYFWRAAAVIDGETGPWSQKGTFTTKTLPEDQSALITGYIFHDNCQNPYPRDDFPADYTPPEGCIISVGEGNYTQVLGDGLFTTRDQGIPGARITLCTGVCPYEIGSACRDIMTNPYRPWTGEYFAYVDPGTYCLMIHHDQPGNETFNPWEGLWTTFGRYNHDTPMTTVNLDEPGEVAADTNFGWDDHGVDFSEYIEVSGLVTFSAQRTGADDVREYRMSNAVVYLAEGSCDPDWKERIFPPQQTGTGYIGSYEYTNLEPGEYCLAMDGSSWADRRNPLGLDSLVEINPDQLLSIPLSEVQEISSRAIYQVDHALLYAAEPLSQSGAPLIQFTVEPGDKLRSQSFRWINWPLIAAAQETLCRSGPDQGYESALTLERGDSAYLLARIEDNSWWKTAADCWVPSDAVVFHGDPGVLPVAEIPPTAVPVPPTEAPPPRDTKAPSVNVSHQPSNPSHTDQVTIKANASDNQGVVRISIWTSRFPNIWSINPQKTCQNTTSCSTKVGPIDPGDSRYYFARAWDAAGNQAQSSTGSFTTPH